MKLTKSKLKELIIEVLTEDNVMDKKIKYKDKDGNSKEATVGGILKKGEKHPAYKDAKAMTKGGGEKEKKGSTNINIDADPFSGDSGGPSYSNVPKGAKSSKQAVKMKNIDNLNKQAQKGDAALVVTQYNGTVTWDEGDPNEETFFVTTPDGDEMEIGYDEIIRMSGDKDGSIVKSLQESKVKRFTVKEVHRWMKTLEENRYRKIVNADARRVAWLVNNNLSEDYESMPKTMRKKWSKAQYGRERYLAKEFLKSQLASLKEQLKRQKKGKLTEDKFIAFYKKERVTVNAKSLWDAKKQIIAKLKVPKKDVGLVSVLNKTEYDKQKFRFEGKLKEIKKQNAIDVARKVVKTKQYDKDNGMDLTTANFIVQVYDSQKKNPAVQKKLAKMSVVQLSKVIGKLLR